MIETFEEIQNKLQLDILEQTHLLAYRGSISHNMYVPNTNPNSIDDIDLMGFVIPDKSFYFGLNNYENNLSYGDKINRKGTKEYFINEYDMVFYEMSKTIYLLVKGNPNVLSLLWLKPEHYIKITEWGGLLLKNRELFTNKKSFHKAISGYATGQLKKMSSRNPQGYMGEKRKKLVEKFGYDTKNASHLIRLLIMGAEYLDTGVLNVYRTDDVEFLLDIKKGIFTLDQILGWSNDYFSLLQLSYENSKLPEKLDIKKINQLSVDIIEGSLYDS